MRESARTENQEGHRHHARLLVALLIFGAVLLVALHFTEEEEFIELIRRAQPHWILLGFFLQAATYFSQALIWKTGLRTMGEDDSTLDLVRLSFAQLFINQAVPSAAISGALFVFKALQHRRIPQAAIASTMATDFMGYLGGYCLAILLAVSELSWRGVLGIKAFFSIVLVLALIAVLLPVSLLKYGRWIGILLRNVRPFRSSKMLKSLLEFGGQIRSRHVPLKVVAQVVSIQLGIFACDTLTLWSMLRALGLNVDPRSVYASYVLASIAKTIGFMPGGLGIFEAASIATLHLADVPVAGGLAATLMFRGLSFWLPMIPGLFLARQELRRT